MPHVCLSHIIVSKAVSLWEASKLCAELCKFAQIGCPGRKRTNCAREGFALACTSGVRRERCRVFSRTVGSPRFKSETRAATDLLRTTCLHHYCRTTIRYLQLSLTIVRLVTLTSPASRGAFFSRSSVAFVSFFSFSDDSGLSLPVTVTL